MTPVERLILSNQYEILSALGSPEQEEHQRSIAILRRGYSHEMDGLTDGHTAIVSAETCRQVKDTFILYSWIYAYTREYPDDEEVSSHRHAKFRGYDGNNESDALGYAQFLLLDEELWSDLVPEKAKRSTFNSHARMRDTYESMCGKYVELGQPIDPTKEHVLAVLNAG